MTFDINAPAKIISGITDADKLAATVAKTAAGVAEAAVTAATNTAAEMAASLSSAQAALSSLASDATDAARAAAQSAVDAAQNLANTASSAVTSAASAFESAKGAADKLSNMLSFSAMDPGKWSASIVADLQTGFEKALASVPGADRVAQLTAAMKLPGLPDMLKIAVKVSDQFEMEAGEAGKLNRAVTMMPFLKDAKRMKEVLDEMKNPSKLLP